MTALSYLALPQKGLVLINVLVLTDPINTRLVGCPEPMRAQDAI